VCHCYSVLWPQVSNKYLLTKEYILLLPYIFAHSRGSRSEWAETNEDDNQLEKCAAVLYDISVINKVTIWRQTFTERLALAKPSTTVAYCACVVYIQEGRQTFRWCDNSSVNSHTHTNNYKSIKVTQSNLGTRHVTTPGSRPTNSCCTQSFNCICQVAPICMPIWHAIPWPHPTHHP